MLQPAWRVASRSRLSGVPVGMAGRFGLWLMWRRAWQCRRARGLFTRCLMTTFSLSPRILRTSPVTLLQSGACRLRASARPSSSFSANRCSVSTRSRRPNTCSSAGTAAAKRRSRCELPAAIQPHPRRVVLVEQPIGGGGELTTAEDTRNQEVCQHRRASTLRARAWHGMPPHR